MIGYIMSARSVTVNVDGHNKIVHKDSPLYVKIVDALKAGDLDSIVGLFQEEKLVRDVYGINISIQDGIATIDGEELPSLLSQRLVEFAKEKLPYDYLVAFWNRIKANPSRSSVQEGFDMLERNHHPILPDGRFLAWKAVTSEFKDKRTGKFDNSPGQVVEMPRRNVDDNRGNECSYGFHVGSTEYVRNFGNNDDRYILVVVDPADIVSVPTDSNCQKMRVCKYEVLKEISRDEVNAELYGQVY